MVGPRALHPSRRDLLAAGGAVGAGALLAACGGDGGSGGGDKGTAWTFTDDRGKKVSLDHRPRHVVAYVATAAALHDFGVGDRIVGVFGPTTQRNGKPDPLAGDLDVHRLTVLGTAWGQFDIEKYAALNPDLLVTNTYERGSLWYVPDQSQQKILHLAPSVAFTAARTPIIEPIKRYAALARALGADLTAPRVTEDKKRFEAASEALRKAAKGNRVRVMAASGSANLFYVSTPKVNTDLMYYQQLGVDLVVPEHLDKQGYFEDLSWENADKYDADVILLDDRASALQPKDLAAKPTWSRLPAVKAGQVIPWGSEPRFSYAGATPPLEALAKAIRNAKKVS